MQSFAFWNIFTSCSTAEPSISTHIIRPRERPLLILLLLLCPPPRVKEHTSLWLSAEGKKEYILRPRAFFRSIFLPIIYAHMCIESCTSVLIFYVGGRLLKLKLYFIATGKLYHFIVIYVAAEMQCP